MITCAQFVEPTRGERKFCSSCGRTRLLHKARAPKVDAALLDKFRAAAEALNALPHADGYECSVALGVDDDTVTAIAALPGAEVQTRLFRDGRGARAIDVVFLLLDGVQFNAQRDSRATTPEETARLDSEGHECGRLVIA